MVVKFNFVKFIDHLKENLGAIDWNLSAEDVKLLDETEFESSND